MLTPPSIPNEKRTYPGSEKRRSPRIAASYPIRFQRVLPSGEKCDRYAQTRNVSAEGVLMSCGETLTSGTRVDVSIAIPLGHATSLPAAQLDGAAVVVRTEPASLNEDGEFAAIIALRFLQPPTVSTELSMFD